MSGIRLIGLDERAVEFFATYGAPPEEWFQDPEASSSGVSQAPSADGSSLLLYLPASSAVRLLIRVDEGGLGAIASKEIQREAFIRIVRIAAATIAKVDVPIPSTWSPYRTGSRLQVNAASIGKRSGYRLTVDRNVTTGKGRPSCIYMFDVRRGVAPIDDIQFSGRDVTSAIEILDQLHSEISGSVGSIQDRVPGDYSLDGALPAVRLGLGLSLAAWYDGKLTQEQRAFVDYPLGPPVKVRGPAGSGKTVALAVKALMAVKRHLAGSDVESGFRLLLLTHSSSTVELLKQLLETMIAGAPDEVEVHGRIDVKTLPELAAELVNPGLHGLSPLSLDGAAGREDQEQILSAILKEYVGIDWIGRRGKCSEPFREALERAAREGGADDFTWEVLNEFACVLDATGVKDSEDKQRKYVEDANRKAWMMPLSTPGERQVIVDLYRRFRSWLRDIQAIGLDQLMADLHNFLDQNIWNSRRKSSGWSAVFVDECHLFSRVERECFHMLGKDPNSPVPLVYALDSRQALRATYAKTSKSREDSGRKDFQLSEVFRYTAQIAGLVSHIAHAMPGVELGEEESFDSIFSVTQGAVPRAFLLDSTAEIYEQVCASASARANELRDGRSVAVLIGDAALFARYRDASKHRSAFFVIENRDDILLYPKGSHPFILSRPDYVAGLQFDEVYFVELNRSAFSSIGESFQARRAALAALYLGCSRAAHTLTLVSNASEGGYPSIIVEAERAGLVSVESGRLKR